MRILRFSVPNALVPLRNRDDDVAIPVLLNVIL